MRQAVISLLVLALLSGGIASIAQVPGVTPESPVTFGGYIKYLVQDSIPTDGDESVDHLINQRFNLEYRLFPDISFKAGMRNRLFAGDSLDIPRFKDLVGEDTGYWDLSNTWVDDKDIVGNTILDRLYLDWKPDDWQVRFGRQRINWGMVNTWNPNDLFNSYSMFDIDYEERPGSDALLVGRSLGFASRADAAWAMGDTWDETSLAGRYLFNTSGYDIQLIGGKNRSDIVGGGGFSGSIMDAAVRGEVSHFEPYLDEWNGQKTEASTVASLETDYSIKSQRNFQWLFGMLYTSNPENTNSALSFLNQPLTARTLSFASWTGYGSLGFDITSLIRQNAGIGLYDDGSVYINADTTVSLADDWDLLLVWQHYDGHSDSLFGVNPTDLLLARIRWSF